ncbi:helix-turn-helix transcriptional regulator [Ulvibacterium sp.]|uniref:helix-turn-helix domain-containing protein n=1 Tax=Ulvibacterium sp. TaxID=2665914 RepID=UPI002604B2BC|nr:helix-turn-helix transcriptional regulator [Ulvibacterium sp.]
MPIVVNLDVMLAKRKMSLTELSEKVGITISNLSILKKGKAKAIRFSTLQAICEVLECQPGDILEYIQEQE